MITIQKLKIILIYKLSVLMETSALMQTPTITTATLDSSVVLVSSTLDANIDECIIMCQPPELRERHIKEFDDQTDDKISTNKLPNKFSKLRIKARDFTFNLPLNLSISAEFKTVNVYNGFKGLGVHKSTEPYSFVDSELEFIRYFVKWTNFFATFCKDLVCGLNRSDKEIEKQYKLKICLYVEEFFKFLRRMNRPKLINDLRQISDLFLSEFPYMTHVFGEFNTCHSFCQPFLNQTRVFNPDNYCVTSLFVSFIYCRTMFLLANTLINSNFNNYDVERHYRTIMFRLNRLESNGKDFDWILF
ncbi:hypothetical protein GEMRC1_012543 [Eukaryota sp. GEM-RC1]